MKTIRRGTGALAGLVAACALGLLGSSPASAATWTLEDVQQRICVDPEYGHPGAYFLVVLNGTWSTELTAGLRDLPPGSTSPGDYPIAPGTGDGHVVQTLVPVSIAPAPAGEYTSELWASDGTETQEVPVRIAFEDGC